MSRFPVIAAASFMALGTASAAVSADNLATTQAIYSAFGAGDIPAILAQLSEAVEWDHGYDGTGVPFLTPRTGPEDVGAFFNSLSMLEFRKFDVLNMLEGGDQVAVVVDLEAVVKDTGATIADQEVHLWTFGEDGKVIRFRHFLDGEEFLAAME